MIKRMILVAMIAFVTCDKDPVIDHDTMLDGNKIFDPSLYQPEKYLVSAANPNPTASELEKPVIITSHGYSASTFEWDEFRAWAGENSGFTISQVLLGGHGRTYETFKNSTWKDWQSAIVDEYEKLEQLGYRKISLLGSSTSCALMLKLVANNYFSGKTAPKTIFLVDPIVIPSDKMLSLIGIVGPMLGYTENSSTPEEESKWYHFFPYETLQELNNVITMVRKDLESGITLPPNTQMKVYKSKKDPSADPVSAVLIYKGIKTASGKTVDIKMIDSDLHVFTRLAGRERWSPKDKKNQLETFEEIKNMVVTEK